jgi:hypothetical protein
LQIENLEFVFWLDNALAWNGLILVSCLGYSKQCFQCRCIYCAWELSIVYLFFMPFFWDGVAHLKKTILHGGGHWREVNKEHPGISHVPLACHLWEAGLLTKEGAPKIPSPHIAIAHQSRGGHVMKVNRVRGTLSSRILETNSGRGINMMQIGQEL